MDFPATASVHMPVALEHVWAALTDPARIREVLFGTEVISDWHVGSPIVYRNHWEGKPFEDKGEILAIEPHKLFHTTYYSPLSGRADHPNNYHLVAYELAADANGTLVSVTQTNNLTYTGSKRAAQSWMMLLDHMKSVLASH